MTAIVVDCETTGLIVPSCSELSKQPRIIELGCALIENGAVVSEHEWLIFPEQEVSEEITKITGIKNEDLKGKPLFRQLLPKIAEVFKKADTLFAHNAPFDTACIEFELQRCGNPPFPWPGDRFCSAQEFAHEFGRRPRLIELYEAKLGVPLKQEHRALSDVRALSEIIIKEKLA